MTGNSAGVVTGIGSGGPIRIDVGEFVAFAFVLAALDTFQFEAGLPGNLFVPPRTLTGTSARYLSSGDQLEFVRNDVFPAPAVTLGFTNQVATGPCFFAMGLAPPRIFAPAPRYAGQADGLAQIGGATSRLFGSEVTVTPGPTGPFNDTFDLRLNLMGLDDAFGELRGQGPVPIGTATANVAYDDRGFIGPNTITGPTGFAGTVRGSPAGASGLVLTFQMHNAAGDVIWGAAAVDSTQSGT